MGADKTAHPHTYITYKPIREYGRKEKDGFDRYNREDYKGYGERNATAHSREHSKSKELYEVLNVRGIKGVQLRTAQECLDYVSEYLHWCRANPLTKYEMIKGGQSAGELIALPMKRSPSVGAFCLFIGWSIKEFNKNREKLEKSIAESDEAIELYYGYSLIKELIETDMDEGALAGLVDANYMAKLRGLRDLKDVTSNGKEAGTKAMQVNVLSAEAVDNIKNSAVYNAPPLTTLLIWQRLIRR